MPIVTIILVLLFVGFLLWVVKTAPLPIDPWFKTLIAGVIVFAFLLWFLGTVLGIDTGLGHFRLR